MPLASTEERFFPKNGETGYTIREKFDFPMAHSGKASEEKISEHSRKIFSTLANEDALRIFSLAADGIEAGRGFLQENDFTKKRYYVRLGELVDMGLVTKEKGVYRHTPLGSIVYESQVTSLKRILAKSQSLEILGDLRRRNKSDESLRNAVVDLSQHLLKDVETSIGMSNLKPVKLITSWSEFFSQVSMMMDSARSEVCIGTRTFDSKLARAALKAAEAGCIVDIIHNRIRELNPSDSTKEFQEDMLDLLNALKAHPNVRLRRGSVPYSFFAIDKVAVALEITHPEEQESFFLGITFQNPEVAAMLASYYRELAKGTKIDTTSPLIGMDGLLR